MSEAPVHSASVPQGPSPERPRLRRYFEDGYPYLITTATHGRLPLLRDPQLANVVIANLRFYRDRLEFRLHAYVVMPDHLHLLLTPNGANLSSIMRSLKSYTAKQFRELLSTAGPFWQHRFHDRGIRDERAFETAVRYIHENPVKARLCSAAEEFAFSSASVYAGTGRPLGVDLLDGSRLGP